MDINDIVRGFFGFNRFPPWQPPGFHGDGDDNDDSHGIRNNDPFHTPFDDDFPSLFQQMENMFNSMFSVNPGFLDFPNLEISPSPEYSPRDFMLKDSENLRQEKQQCLEPYCNPMQQPMKDIDLDEKVSKGGLSALNECFPIQEKTPKSWSFRKSVSTRIVRSPDGTIEEHKSITDNDGKTVTTVRKTIGDKTYQVTTESDKIGLIEKKEDFINLDEKELDDFQKNWHITPRFPLFKAPIESKENIPLSAPPGDPKYMQIFKKFFG